MWIMLVRRGDWKPKIALRGAAPKVSTMADTHGLRWRLPSAELNSVHRVELLCGVCEEDPLYAGLQNGYYIHSNTVWDRL